MRGLISTLLIAYATAFTNTELSSRVYGACDAPPLHLMVIADHSADKTFLNARLASAASNLVLRSGCAANSKVGLVVARSSPSINVKLGELAPTSILQSIDTTATTNFDDLDKAFELAGKEFDRLNTEKSARGVVMFSAGSVPNDRHLATAAAASLQQRGFRMIAVTPKLEEPFAYSGGFDLASSQVRQAVAALVSYPTDRHILHASFIQPLSSFGVGSHADLAFPDRIAQTETSVVSQADTKLLIPMDPRSADPCVVPRTCVVSAGGNIRSMTGESYAVRRTGEFVLASFRSPMVGQADVYGGFGQCANATGVCLHSVKVVTRGRMISINAAPHHRGTRIIDTANGAEFEGAVETETRFAAAVEGELSVHSADPIAGTWTSTAGPTAGKNSELMGAFAIQVLSMLDTRSNAIAHIRVDYDLDAAHVAVSMTLAADTSPIRTGLCGVPAGPAGEAASPEARLPRANVAYPTVGNMSDLAVYAASEGQWCPPVSQPYRPISTDADGLRRMHVTSYLTDSDAAHMERLLGFARGMLPAYAHRPVVSYLSHEEFPVRTPAVHPACTSAFGERSVMAQMCNDNAAVGMSAPVFPVLRAVTALCRLRCAHPDDVMRGGSRLQVLRGGASQSDLSSEGRGSEILGDLVTVGWCDQNVCRPGVPALTKLSSAGGSEDYFMSQYTPLWALLSRRRSSTYVNELLKAQNMFETGTENNMNAIVTPPIAGHYRFRARASQASCKHVTTNVSLSVRCPNQLQEPSAGPDVNVTIYNGGFPWVSLYGQVRLMESLATPPQVSVYWGVHEAPNRTLDDYEEDAFSQINVDEYFRFQSSAASMFRPMWPGRWVLHMSVYDGCQVRSRNVVVNAKCWEGCGGQRLRITRADTIDLTGTRTAMLGFSYTSAVSTSELTVPSRNFNITTPFIGYEAMPSTAASWKVNDPLISTPATARSYDGRHPTSEVQDRFNWFIDRIAPVSDRRTLHNNVDIGTVHTYSFDTFTDSREVGWMHSTVNPAKPTQCGVRASSTDTLGAARTASMSPSLPQKENLVVDFKWWKTAAGFVSNTVRGDCNTFDQQVPKSVATADAGVVVALESTNRLMVGRGLNQGDCNEKNVLTANVSVLSLRQPVAYDVSITVTPRATMATPIIRDGRVVTRAWLEYRSVAEGDAVAPKWADHDPVGPAGSVWKPVGGSEIVWNGGLQDFLVGRIHGPAVVRVHFDFAGESTETWYITSGLATPVVDPLVTPSKICDDKHVTMRVQGTDGCHLSTDHAETSFECHIPPHVELVTPHYQVEFNYADSQFPPVILTVNPAEEHNLHRLVLATEALQIPSDTVNLVKDLEDDYNYKVVVYHNVPGYASGVPVVNTLTIPTAARSQITNTRCTARPTLGEHGVYAYRKVNNQPAYTILTSPDSESLWSIAPHSTFNWAVGCGKVSSVNETVDYIFDPASNFDENVTHVNMSYYVHAATPLLGADQYVLRVWYASYSYLTGTHHDLADVPPMYMFKPLFEINQQIQQSRLHAPVQRSIVFPIVGGQRSQLVIRMSLDRVKANTETDPIGHTHVVSLGDIKLAPAYASVFAMPSATTLPLRATGEGVSRFGYIASNPCGETVSYLDIEAKCKHDIPVQTWTAHALNASSADRYLAATGSATSTGNGRLVLHPQVRASLLLAVADNVQVVDGTGSLTARLEDSENILVSHTPPSAWSTYGVNGGVHPGTGAALTSTDLIDGTFATMTYHYSRATSANLVLDFTDGCRTRSDVVPVDIECSATDFKTPATYVLDQNFEAVDPASLKVNTRYYLHFLDNAHHTLPGAPSTSESNISGSSTIGTEVTITARPSDGGAEWRWNDAGVASRTISYEADGTTLRSLRWIDRPSTTMTAFTLTQSGDYSISVKHGAWKFDCAESAAYTLTVKASDKCAKGRTSMTFAPQYPEEYIWNATITIPSYPTADFTSATAAKGKPKLEAALNTILAKMNARVEWIDLVTTGADPRLVVVVVNNMTSVGHVELLNDEVRDGKSFQRTFGYVSTITYTNTRSVPFTATLSWDGDLAARSELSRLQLFNNLDVCGGTKPACPTFASATARTLDIKVEMNWAVVVPGSSFALTPSLDVDFADEDSWCTAATFAYNSLCRYITGPLDLSPVAVTSVHSAGSAVQIPSAVATPVTLTYASSEARTFPRVYLYDSATVADFYFSPRGVRTEYEWWIKSAPARSIYSNKDGLVEEKPQPNNTAIKRMSFLTSTYDIPTTDAAVSDYWTKWPQYTAHELVQLDTDVKGDARVEWGYVRLPNQCLDDTSANGLRPRSETCFSPDVPGTYTLVYRARGSCDTADTEWRNATMVINAECPAFSATLPEGLPTKMQSYVAADRLSAPVAATANAELALALNLDGTLLKDHVVVKWDSKFTVSANSPQFEADCQARWHDGLDINATVMFPCAGEYNVSVTVTDGCTVKQLFHVVEVTCDSADALATTFPNSTVFFDVPEGGTMSAFGTIELSPGNDAAMDTLERAEGSLPCASSITWQWEFDSLTPADDYVIAREFAFDPQHLAEAGVRVLGAAADYRSAGETTDGDVLTTIMVFAIGVSVVVALSIIVFLIVSKREATAAGILKPSEPLPSKPLPEYS